jgi:FAD/FMN-containing dehydrogenase
VHKLEYGGEILMKIPKTLTGLVVDRCSPLYNEARMDFNSRFSLCPRYIVFAQDVHDVQTAILWARRHNLPLRARSGRHSYEAYSLVNGGLVIDVSPLNKVILDRKKGRATIGAGANLTTVYTELWNQGKVTIPGGSCGGVGIAGLTLGGGFGLISRLLGLTCDALVSLEMVDANGRIIHASPNENADLFWASCGGGGGNFGVVTEFTFNDTPSTR